MKWYKRLFVITPLVISLFLGSVVSVSAAGVEYDENGSFLIDAPLADNTTGVIGPLNASKLDSSGRAFIQEWQNNPGRFLVAALPTVNKLMFVKYPYSTSTNNFTKPGSSISSSFLPKSDGKYESVVFSLDTGDPIISALTNKHVSWTLFHSTEYLKWNYVRYDYLVPVGAHNKMWNLWKPVWDSDSSAQILLDDDPNSPLHSLTINYQFLDGSQAAPSHCENVLNGSPYSVESPVLDGYTADKPTVSGTMGTEDVTITVTYTRIPQPHTLTVQYQKEDGTQAAPAHTESILEGESYHITSPPLEGYTPDKATISGTMGNADITETVTYHKNPPPIVDHVLTINYIKTDGAQVAESHVQLLSEGKTYQVVSPVLEGYKPDQLTVSGTMGTKDITVTVIYAAYAPIVRHTLTIQYQLPDGGQAAPDYIGEFTENEPYNVPSPIVAGYRPSLSNVAGTMPGKDHIETVVYSVDSPSGSPILTVKYQYEDGRTAAPAYSQETRYGTSYWIPSPAVAGYSPSKRIIFGAMEKQDVTYTVTYSPGFSPGSGGGITFNPGFAGGIEYNPSPGGGIEFHPSGGGGVGFYPFPKV